MGEISVEVKVSYKCVSAFWYAFYNDQKFACTLQTFRCLICTFLTHHTMKSGIWCDVGSNIVPDDRHFLWCSHCIQHLCSRKPCPESTCSTRIKALSHTHDCAISVQSLSYASSHFISSLFICDCLQLKEMVKERRIVPLTQLCMSHCKHSTISDTAGSAWYIEQCQIAHQNLVPTLVLSHNTEASTNIIAFYRTLLGVSLPALQNSTLYRIFTICLSHQWTTTVVNGEAYQVCQKWVL